MKKTPAIFAFILILDAFLASGCRVTGDVSVDNPDPSVEARDRDTIRGSGTVVTEDRALGGFQRVSLQGSGDVIISQGDEEALTVEADDNLMGYINTEVTNGTLVLDFTDEAKRKNIRPDKGIKFHLKVKELTGLDLLGAGDIDVSVLETERLKIYLAGSGDVNASSLEADRLEIVLAGAGDVGIDSLAAEALVITLNGAGDVELAGHVVEQGLFLNGAGDYRAGELESQAATIEINGVGRAVVWASDALDVRINGPSTVEYYGNPRVTKNIAIVGRLVGLGEP